MTKWLISVSIALTLAVGVVHAAGDVEAGKAKAVVCSGCHGPDGNSFNPVWPKLAGQSASYLSKQINDLKSGARKDPIMSAQAAALTDEDIANVTAFFSSQTRTSGTPAAEQAELGGKIYRAGNTVTGVAACMACHGPSGAGNPAAGFPSLAGQQAGYVEKALKDFRSGTRTNDANAMMRGVTANMTDAEITAVSQFILGMKN
jgi:cytochrome c553